MDINNIRTRILGIKEFDNLTSTEKRNYFLGLLFIPEQMLTSIDKHILKYYSIVPVEVPDFCVEE